MSVSKIRINKIVDDEDDLESSSEEKKRGYLKTKKWNRIWSSFTARCFGPDLADFYEKERNNNILWPGFFSPLKNEFTYNGKTKPF